MSSQIEQIKSLVGVNQGIVFLGPDLFLPSLNHSHHSSFDSIKESLNDAVGWETFDEDCQLELAITELGKKVVVEKLAHEFPYLELSSSDDELSRSLRGFHPDFIVDLNYHNAVDSFLVQRHQVLNRVVSDADVRRNQFGEITPSFYKVRGDLWLENACLTIESLDKNLRENPHMRAQIIQICKREPVIFIGFKPNSNLFRWLINTFTDAQSSVLVCFVSSNRTWRKWCQNAGYSTLCAPTRTELIQKLSDFFKRIPDPIEDKVLEARVQIAQDCQNRLRKLVDQMVWVDEARQGNRQEIREANEKITPICQQWISFHRKQLLVDPEPTCRAIGFQTRCGFGRDADLIIDSVLSMVRTWPLNQDHLLASLGRSLMRNDDDWRGFILLRKALLSEQLSLNEQADSLAWVSKAVLARIEELMMRGHVRAATEQIAQFLNTFASFLSIGNGDANDDESKWSLYYINLRLGRIMMLASGMAGNSNKVYAQQAVNLLLRTIEFVPEKPDGYKYLRPMLTDTESPTFNLKRWDDLLNAAPPAIQKKIGATQPSMK